MRRRYPVERACSGAEAQTRTETVNRRVWVTARSRQSQMSVEKHASKLATEIAAPSSFNGPQYAPSPLPGHRECGWKQGDWRIDNRNRFSYPKPKWNQSGQDRGFLPFAFQADYGGVGAGVKGSLRRAARALDSGADSPENPS